MSKKQVGAVVAVAEKPKMKFIQAMSWKGQNVEPLDFDIFSEEISAGGYVIPDRKAIFRQDSDGNKIYLATVSGDYNIVKHPDVVEHVEKQMSFGPNTTVKTILTTNGKQMHRIYTLHDYQVEVKPGDTISPVIRVVNSYDGSTTVNFKCDCVRRVCMNGMIALSSFSKMSYKHFGRKFDINRAFDVEFKQLINDFEDYSKNWTSWLNEKVSNERAALVLNYMPTRLRPYIMARYAENLDGTKYGLYNAYTQALTHDFHSTRAANEDLQKIVLGTIITKVFAKSFYWNASEDEIKADLIHRRMIKPETEKTEETEEPEELLNPVTL